VLCIVLVLLLAVAGIFAYKFRSHIRSAVIFLTTSSEDIRGNIDKAKDEQSEALINVGFNASKELDEALQSGAITPEEHTQILLGNISLDEVLAKDQENTDPKPDGEVNEDQSSDGVEETQKETENSVPEENKKPVDDAGEENVALPEQNGSDKNNQHKPDKEDKPKQPANKNDKPTDTSEKPSGNGSTQGSSDADKRIAELVTKMYVLKAEYTGAINGVVASMKAEYSKLPREQQTTSSKAQIASGYIGKINAMEAQCDAQVNAIVSELRQILKNNGRDTVLADNILSAYATEKENTKAYYISTYGD
jgi:hypothetical protein